MKKIAVICAMQMEADAVREHLSDVREVKQGAFTFSTGKVGDKEVILALSGVGKVAAAATAQTMILSFAPDAILNVGVAGGLSDKLKILDVALSSALVEHDMDTGPLGDPPGFLPGLGIALIPADKTLLAAAEQAAREEVIRALTGLIASGDQFIATAEQREKILSHFPAIACEMEGAAVAHTAFLNGTPVFVLRAISDSSSDVNGMEFSAFAPLASGQSAKLVLAMLKLL